MYGIHLGNQDSHPLLIFLLHPLNCLIIVCFLLSVRHHFLFLNPYFEEQYGLLSLKLLPTITWKGFFACVREVVMKSQPSLSGFISIAGHRVHSVIGKAAAAVFLFICKQEKYFFFSNNRDFIQLLYLFYILVMHQTMLFYLQNFIFYLKYVLESLILNAFFELQLLENIYYQ